MSEGSVTRRTALAAKWDAFVRKPFLLVRLSMNRIFMAATLAKRAEHQYGTSAGAVDCSRRLASIYFLTNTVTLQWLRVRPTDPLAAALPDEYFSSCLDGVTEVSPSGGGTAYFDRRDFANLVHPPISTFSIFWLTCGRSDADLRLCHRCKRRHRSCSRQRECPTKQASAL